MEINEEKEKEHYLKLLELQETVLEYSVINFFKTLVEQPNSSISLTANIRVWILDINNGSMFSTLLYKKDIKSILEAKYCTFLCFLSEIDAKIFKDLFGNLLQRWLREEQK